MHVHFPLPNPNLKAKQVPRFIYYYSQDQNQSKGIVLGVRVELDTQAPD